MPVAQAVASEQSQAGVEEQRGRVPQVQERLHQRDGPHGPVAAELRWIQQQPGVDGKKVVEGHLSRGGGTDRRWVIEPAKAQTDETSEGQQRRAETGLEIRKPGVRDDDDLLYDLCHGGHVTAGRLFRTL